MEFKIYEVNGKFEIYKATGELVGSCYSKKTAEQTVELLKKQPANDNSILNSKLAKATREILGR